MGPKAKAQKMSLGTFLQDESLGSWADEMEDLPSQPSGGFKLGRGGSDYLLGTGRQEYSRPYRSLPLPTEPPFTAHIGNLSYDISENDIIQHFGSHQVTSVRILRDREDDRPLGYGYVEFSALASLKSALELNGSQLAGRTVRVSVAEPPKDRTLGEWKRAGPLPPLESRSDRVGLSRRSYSHTEEREGISGNWERKGPLQPLSRYEREPQYPSRYRENNENNSPSRADSGTWRSARPVQEAAAPTERKPLSLKPRSSGTATPPTATEAPKSAKASPFGSAKPVDSVSALKKIEEKLEHKQKEQESAVRDRETTEPKEVKHTEPKIWRRHDPPKLKSSVKDKPESLDIPNEKTCEDGWLEVSTKKMKSNAGRF